MNEAAKAQEWLIPMDTPKQIDFELHVTREEYERLTLGAKAEGIDDRWYIYCEDNWLYFHRLWTGYGIYKAQLFQDTDGYSMKNFWVERNAVKYTNTNDKVDIAVLSNLIKKDLLAIDMPGL
jgi:hypothetical protein